MGTTCCKCVRDRDSREKYFLLREDSEVYDSSTFGLPGQVQISVECEEKPEGRDGLVVYDTEAFPLVNYLHGRRLMVTIIDETAQR